MNAQDIDTAKTREINEATQWLISRQLAGLLQEAREFPAPPFIGQMEIVHSMLLRLQEIDVPTSFAGIWRAALDDLDTMAADMRGDAEWHAEHAQGGEA